ncbi:MAG TPA: AMP-binding protein, partial [Polyangia bacterium]
MVAAGPVNLASSILEHASRAPKRIALVTPGEPALGFGELADRVARLRDGLARQGIRPGDRVLVLAPLGADMIAVSLALLASAATLVTLDGQLGPRRVARALAVARPRAVISLARLLRFWPLSPALARARRFAIDGDGAGARFGTATRFGVGARLATQPFAVLVGAPNAAPPVEPTAAAMVSFSSGTSGRPKGAERSHEILLAQHEALARAFPVVDGDVDMPAFPALTLHNLACGITTVLPPVDLRQPASVDAWAIVEAARRYGVTTMSGSPAYLLRVARHLIDARVMLPRVRRVAVGGAPVSRTLCRALRQAFPTSEGLVVYGSTEAEPMAHVGIDEVASAEGAGFLVGAVDPAAEIELVELPAACPAGAGDRLRD